VGFFISCLATASRTILRHTLSDILHKAVVTHPSMSQNHELVLIAFPFVDEASMALLGSCVQADSRSS
jgi:hypothetical protein